MSSKKILYDLISTYGNLRKEQNEKIIDDYFKENSNPIKINNFINYYNQFCIRPINDYAINMYFKYMK